MHRREFALTLMTTGVVASGVLGAAAAHAQRIAFQEGRDYLKLERPAPVSSPAGQVEVVEFFAYTCIHCYRFEPLLHDWIKKLPADVRVRRVPVAFNSAFVPMQRLYFAIETLGLVDSLHEKVFRAIHDERVAMNTPAAIAAWVERQGVNRDQFAQAFNGSAVKMADSATLLQEAYQVEGTPALGVAGRFYISGQGPRTMLIADSLIAQVRKG